MIQLAVDTLCGQKCVVVTANPEAIKKDFSRMTGLEIRLKARKDSDVYDVSLVKK